MKELALDCAKRMHGGDRILAVALRLEDAIRNDEALSMLLPTVEFYSAVLLDLLKIPAELFPIVVTIPRTVGWLAHWLEHQKDPDATMARPNQVYVGATQ